MKPDAVESRRKGPADIEMEVSGPAGAALFLDGRGGARQVALEEALDRQPGDGVLWVHLDYQNPGSRRWLAEHGGLCRPDMEALLNPVTETRVEVVDDDRLLLALLVAVPGVAELRSLRAVLAPDHAVTFFRGRLPALESALGALRVGRGPRTVAELLTRLLDETCTHVELLRLRLDQELADLEWTTDGASRPTFERLALLQRATVQARRGLHRQRNALGRIAGAASPWLLDENLDQWKELANRTDDLVAGLDDIADGLRAVGEDLRSRLSSAIHDRVRLLALLSSIALPLLILGGFLGVNLGH
jgi:zinc transporter